LRVWHREDTEIKLVWFGYITAAIGGRGRGLNVLNFSIVLDESASD
jgi:hypothetical protein